MTQSIRFGTDGWRGVIADDFTFENLRRVASATASYIRDAKLSAPVLIGYDRRFLSREFAEAVARVFESRGVDSRISASVLGTPALSVMVAHEKAPWGIMITASHNPAGYNGFKIKSAEGCSAPPEVTASIEKRLEGQASLLGERNERALKTFDSTVVYDAYLKKQLDWKRLRGSRARVVFDFLHGVGAGVPERLFKKSPLRLIGLHSEVDPLFGGLHPEPIEDYLGVLKLAVPRAKALVGIATDGDADRLGIVDDRGRYLTPHQVFPLLVLHQIYHRKRRGKIVQSVSLGVLGERIAQEHGLPFEEVPVGFKHIAELMLREDVMAGGEESGGYAFAGGLPERDGLLCGLLFLEMCVASGKKPSALLDVMEKKYGAARFKRIDLQMVAPVWDKARFVETILQALPKSIAGKDVVEKRIGDGLKVLLSNGAWVLLRPSGTEPLVRTYAESSEPAFTDALLTWAGIASRAAVN